MGQEILFSIDNCQPYQVFEDLFHELLFAKITLLIWLTVVNSKQNFLSPFFWGSFSEYEFKA